MRGPLGQKPGKPDLELIGTKKSDETLELEMDQSKRNYLHPKEGTDAAKIGAGLFINKL